LIGVKARVVNQKQVDVVPYHLAVLEYANSARLAIVFTPIKSHNI